MTAVSGDIATGTAPASLADAQEAFPGLPKHVVITHILRTEHFDDPADLARLPAVSRAMRDAVAATGLEFEELDDDQAVKLGCVSAVRRLQLAGHLTRQELLCKAAARSGQLEVLKWLRAGGCPWDAGTCWAAAEGGHLEVLQWAHANGCQWDKSLYIAAGKGHEAVMRALIEAGADINKASFDGVTPLVKATQEGHVAVVLALIEADADINKATDNGRTPLYFAAQAGYETLVRALIEAGADVKKAAIISATPLFIAAANGHEVVVWALIDAGADVNKAGDNGVTPLFIAARKGQKVVLQALINAGADVNKATDNGMTPLSESMTPFVNVAQGGHPAIVQLLKDAGAV